MTQKKSLFLFDIEGENETVFDPFKPCISSRKGKHRLAVLLSAPAGITFLRSTCVKIIAASLCIMDNSVHITFFEYMNLKTLTLFR